MYQVYILQSQKDKRTYVGFSEDAEGRLKEHNIGKVKATKNRRPLVILMMEECKTLAEAKIRELYWKSGGGRRKIKDYFIKGFPPIQKF
ncbi:GIY-YIG nuclease family protein [Patescibacteria group bacterium]|nr:GIY-YIG nuclease family protein [Patescibacteria group bacterium]